MPRDGSSESRWKFRRWLATPVLTVISGVSARGIPVPGRHSTVVFARAEATDRFAVGPVDLVVEEKIGSQPAGRIWIDASQLVADDECRRCRLPVESLTPSTTFDRRQTVKQNRHAIAEAQVLRPLADVEADARLALPRVPACRAR